ncbi:MAG: ATP-dependent DNA ligase [Alphaproteobacteria bacterium]|jgi:bifunctional non-homologous end joining protein LigD|nr:ATP-dependent DNA ligase [Alphaproteobacteria bacterium]
MTATREIDAGGRTVGIKRPDKVLFPDCGLTKGDLAAFYARVAETALPHWRDRAVSLKRFPDGIEAQGFFQKRASDHFPDWIATARLPGEDGPVDYVVIDQAATLVYLADQGTIEPHVMLSRIDEPDRPDRLVLDFDPSDDDFDKVRAAAQRAAALFDRLDLPVFAMTTGSRGVHLVVPLDRSADFDTVRDIARRLAERLAGDAPDLMTVEQRKAGRGDRVFVDWLRNAYGQTTVAPYGVRARPGAPVATPIDRDELADPEVVPQRWTVANLFRRLGQKADPWAGIDREAVAIGRAVERLDGS